MCVCVYVYVCVPACLGVCVCNVLCILHASSPIGWYILPYDRPCFDDVYPASIGVIGNILHIILLITQCVFIKSKYNAFTIIIPAILRQVYSLIKNIMVGFLAK